MERLQWRLPNWASFPDVDDHEPPNMHDVASQEDLGMHELVGDLDYFEDYEKHHHRQLLRASRRQPSKDSLPNFAKAADLHLQGLERGLSTDANNKVSIDLVVLYTRRAMCAQAYMPPSCEGTMANRAPIEARIMLAMSESNTAYLLSNVYVNLVLKHMELAEDYDDSGAYGEILADFKNRGDGKVDQVHTLRERYKADLAVLVVENSQYCGLGYMFNGNKEYGFSVTSRKCMTGYYSFVHEISHNLGCNHNREVSSRAFPYSHAYLDPSGQFRTIMGYNCRGGCPRVQRFSNPEIEYSQKSIGSTEENNARQMNNVASIVADWYADQPPQVRIVTDSPTLSPTSEPTSTEYFFNPNCMGVADEFGVKYLYASDNSQHGNNWFADFPTTSDFRASEIDDYRLDFKTYGYTGLTGGEIQFRGASIMAISEADGFQGFQDVELTAYVKWENIGRNGYESTIVLTTHAESQFDDTVNGGCDGESYSVSVNRLNGEVQFNKMYFKRGYREVRSTPISTTPDGLRNGIPLNEYVGLKLIAYTHGTLNVKLELYIDQTQGNNGGQWQLVHEYLDRPGSWKAERGWHYSYFARSECSRDDGEPFLGHRKYAKITLDGSNDTEIRLRKISLRNIVVTERIEGDASGCFGESETSNFGIPPATTSIPLASPTPSPTRPSFTPKIRQNTQAASARATPKLNLSFQSIGSIPESSEQEGQKNPPEINLTFSNINDKASDGCDDLGFKALYSSDMNLSNNDWTGDFTGDVVILNNNSPNHPGDDHIFHGHNGNVEIGNGKATFDHQAYLLIKAEDSFKSVEFTGYGMYVADGHVYKESGLKMTSPINYNIYNPCDAASYSATISRETGEAILEKTYWAQSWRSVKATPIVAQIEEFNGGLPLNTWVGMKFITNVISDDEVKLELYIDITKGQGGGEWKLVLEVEDKQGAWSADTKSRMYPYFSKTRCNTNDGQPFVNPASYCFLSVYGNTDTRVQWKDVSVRNISPARVSGDHTCMHQWDE